MDQQMRRERRGDSTVETVKTDGATIKTEQIGKQNKSNQTKKNKKNTAIHK